MAEAGRREERNKSKQEKRETEIILLFDGFLGKNIIATYY